MKPTHPQRYLESAFEVLMVSLHVQSRDDCIFVLCNQSTLFATFCSHVAVIFFFFFFFARNQYLTYSFCRKKCPLWKMGSLNNCWGEKYVKSGQSYGWQNLTTAMTYNRNVRLHYSHNSRLPVNYCFIFIYINSFFACFI